MIEWTVNIVPMPKGIIKVWEAKPRDDRTFNPSKLSSYIGRTPAFYLNMHCIRGIDKFTSSAYFIGSPTAIEPQYFIY